MSTSTPSRKHSDKLYGYLKGFETVGFTGSPASDVMESFSELLTAEMSVYNLDQTTSTASISKVEGLVDTFLAKYYSRMSNITDPLKGKDLADKSKKDKETLSNLISMIVSGSNDPMTTFAICPIRRGEAQSVIDICEKCPYYLGHKFCVIYDRELSDDPDLSVVNFYIPEYKYLALAVIQISYMLIRDYNIEINSLIDYNLLYQSILTNAKIYELMNPRGKAREYYVQKVEELLTQPGLDRASDKYQMYLKVLHSVFDDIRDGKKPYIRDIAKSLNKYSDFIHSKYDEKYDSYRSMKGTAQKAYTRCKYSLVSSCFEVDQYKDLFKTFDEYTGYVSHYPDKDPDYNKPIHSINTLSINNAGKYKTRAIHVGDNPIQDRCNYIHRRLQKVLFSMQCDCTKDQDKGRNFLKLKTQEWFLTKNTSDKKGIYCFDFSNATDTLDQGFQKEVLDFVFGPEIADFWDKVSQLDKYMASADYKSYHVYKQNRGQPQGLLGSFDAFALAHHFIFLMDMKLAGFENRSPIDFYRVLGDDSVMSSLDPEIDSFDESLKDEAGIPRSSLEMIHFDICKEFAGFIINYDKSESTHYNSLEAKLDFAKVTFRNGELFTPIPFRLSMSYGKDIYSKAAVAVWLAERGSKIALPLMDYILNQEGDSRLSDLVHSGLIPCLKYFADGRNYNLPWKSRVRYAVAYGYLDKSLRDAVTQDRSRDKDMNDIYYRSMNSLFDRKTMNRLNNIDPNHKAMIVVVENSEILTCLDQIYDIQDDEESKFLTLACCSLGEDIIQGEFFNSLYNLAQTSRLLRMAKDNPDFDVSSIFPDYDEDQYEGLQQLSRNFVLTKGIHKRPKDEMILLKSIKDILSQLDDILGYIEPIRDDGIVTA